MAAALHTMRNDAPKYTRALINDFDFDDNRYPTHAARSTTSRYQPSNTTERLQEPSDTRMQPVVADGPDKLSSRGAADNASMPLAWTAIDQRSQSDTQYSRLGRLSPQGFPQENPSQQEPIRTTLSYALPPGPSRRVVERYSLEDANPPDSQPSSSRLSPDFRPTTMSSMQDTVVGPRSPQDSSQLSRGELAGNRASPNLPPTTSLRNAASAAQISTGTNSAATSQYPPMMSLSASPAYTPPIAPNHRAYAQQPTYVTQTNAPMQTYTPIIPPQEEVCVECAMRDQDMADVDVTSPGVWDRASDVEYEELKQRELEEEASGVIVDDHSRPHSKGGRLTEPNVKLWLSINPREPTSRQQTLNNYIKAQRTLLEAEALAHARAMQEAKQLDNRMRDAYSQLRRSAYDMGNSALPTDDLGGVRIRPPNSPHSPSWNQSHKRSNSREVTLLENGMIVEHVDVRKEEKEAKERRKKEERRARKSSRGSAMDVRSIISAQSGGPPTENGLKPYSRYSQTSSARPTSVLTAPLDRPDLPRAYSQASFSDVHSLGSASPRRTRFFGMRNLSSGWRSQESFAPSGMSGSMVDMHVALQRENNGASSRRYTTSPIDLNTPRRSQIWPSTEQDDLNEKAANEEKGKKKKKGLAKIWRMVTGKNETQQPDSVKRMEGHEDDLPLTPPPPLSYLVNRGPADGGMRHASTPSLPSVVASPKFGSPGMSPPTAPSSLLPSPTSLRRSGDIEIIEPNGHVDSADDLVNRSHSMTRKSIHSAKSDAQLRPQSILSVPAPPLPTPSNGMNSTATNNFSRPTPLSREKSLPPLPPGEQPARITASDLRPRTYYDHRTLPPGSGPPHDFLPPQAPFRTAESRRQSFGGTSSRPNVHTMPTTRPVAFDSPRRYDDFGASRQSLGRLDNLYDGVRSESPRPSMKRKSKFGLSNLLGKKNDKRASEEKNAHQFPTMPYSSYDAQDDMTGYTTSVSRHSTFSSNAPNSNPRMSVTSRKALEELVQQDAEFVAYRYPSNDQQLDLLR